MFTTARAPFEELRRTLPKLRSLLFAFLVASVVSVATQLSLLEASEESASSLRGKHKSEDRPFPIVQQDDDGSGLGATWGGLGGGPPYGGINGTDFPLSGRSKPHRGDQHFMGILLSLFGLSMSAHDPHLRKRLLTFACFTFLNFARGVVLLVQIVEIPPGARHLLSFHCPVPAEKIAHFVRQQQRHFRRRLELGLPGRERLLLPWEEAWPVALPFDSTVDLCSPSWALSNAYLIASGVCVLWMHAYALRMLRSSSTLFPETDDGVYTEGLVGSAGRVVLIPGGMTSPHPGEREQQHRSFVPFTGVPRKLDL